MRSASLKGQNMTVRAPLNLSTLQKASDVARALPISAISSPTLMHDPTFSLMSLSHGLHSDLSHPERTGLGKEYNI